MDTQAITMLISVGLLLLGVFAGYWFSSINKKTEANREASHINVIDINKNSIELNSLKSANEKAELQLRNEMLELSKDMRDMTKLFSEIGLSVGSNTLRISNLELENKFIADKIRNKEKDK